MSDDFASMMQQAAPEGARIGAQLRPGQAVTGTVVQIGRDSIFVDVGTTTEARIDRREFESAKHELKLQVGDTIRASVVKIGDEGPTLTTALGKGRGKGVDEAALMSALEAGLPVEGQVEKVVKGGLEVRVLGARAFCPASQVDTDFVSDLSAYEGQRIECLVMEVKNGGRDVIVSRRALLKQQRGERAAATLSTLEVGGDYTATVVSTQKYGAFVDLGGGVEGLIHISELAHGRTSRVEDVVTVGEAVSVRLLEIQPPEKAGESPRLRLSLRALQENDNPEPEKGEVLSGTVSKVETFGVFVQTTKGEGLVPTRELGTPRNSDARKQFPVGAEVRVVLLNKDPSRGITFSIARVANVEERQNYREFTRSQKQSTAAAPSMGSFGDLLRQELNLPEPPPQVPEPRAPQAPPAAAPARPVAAPPAAPQAPSPAAAPSPASFEAAKSEPSGIIRGRRRPGQADALRASEKRRSEPK